LSAKLKVVGERLRPNRASQSKSRTRTTTTRRIVPRHRAKLKVVGRGSVRTGQPEQIENENDDDDEKDCSEA
jgi:hypothetical protein